MWLLGGAHSGSRPWLSSGCCRLGMHIHCTPPKLAVLWRDTTRIMTARADNMWLLATGKINWALRPQPGTGT